MAEDTKNQTSFDLYQEAFQLASDLTLSGGEVTEEMEGRLDAFLVASDTKLGAHRYVINQFTERAQSLRLEAKRFAERARTFERVASEVKQHAITVMQARVELLGEKEGRSMDTDHGLVYLKSYTKLVIEDDVALLARHRQNPDYVRVTEKIDRTALTTALKMGRLAGDDVAHLSDEVSIIFQ